MKKITLIVFCILSTNLSGQIVNEQVDFNNYVSAADHDFVNWFNNGLGLNQITTNGITGGCLTVPATMNWGNDNAVYCSKYIGDSASYCRTYISFKYDTAIFSSSGFDRTVSIFLRPSADFNHYVIASVSHTHRIELLTYSWNNNPGPLLNLTHNHWYEFIVRLIFTGGASGDQVDITAVVVDLGISGQDPPIPVNNATGTFNDSILFGDTAIEVSFTATGDGGAKYIDNFKFEGIKSADSCISIPTYLPENSAEDFSAYILDNKLIVQSPSAEKTMTAEIYSANGRLIHSLNLLNHHASLDISGWTSGIYFIRLHTPHSSSVKKIARLR